MVRPEATTEPISSGIWTATIPSSSQSSFRLEGSGQLVGESGTVFGIERTAQRAGGHRHAASPQSGEQLRVVAVPAAGGVRDPVQEAEATGIWPSWGTRPFCEDSHDMYGHRIP